MKYIKREPKEDIKRCNTCGRFLSVSSFYYRNRSKNTRVNICKRCSINKCRMYYEDNRYNLLKYQHSYNNANKKNIAYKRKYKHNYDLEAQRLKQKQWVIKNTDKVKLASKRYRDNNPDKEKEKSIRRRYHIKQSNVPWANKEIIREIYKECKELNNLYPKPLFHVDHIYPLKSDWVCGLHHEGNLVIMTGSENESKSNNKLDTYSLPNYLI